MAGLERHSGGVESLGHPAIDHAIRKAAQYAPAAAERAGRALSRLLDGIRDSPWPEVAWRFSFLTAPMFPLEFSWSSRDPGNLRYTCDVAGPEVDPARRLAITFELIGCLGAAPIADSRQRALLGIQASGSLSYGAWIGARHGASDDRYKIYAEVPEAATGDAWLLFHRVFGEGSLLPHRTTGLRMVGYALDDDRLEFYFRVGRLAIWEVGLLLRECGKLDREPEVLDLLAALYGRPIVSDLPGSSHGFSIAIAPDGNLPVLSLLTFASSVFGREADVHHRLLALGVERGWDLSAYRAMSVSKETGQPAVRHGMIALAIFRREPLALSIGFCPVLGSL
jgi:hypothetical protein